VFIGDQADRNFWTNFRKAVPSFDVVVDDGGHKPNQQTTTMSELLPYLNPGGVYLCEDVHGSRNEFADQVYGLAAELNDMAGFSDHPDDLERRLVVRSSASQGIIESVSYYPFLVAIEVRRRRLTELVAPKRGTHWEPFLS